jgi:hypothetical protein
MLALLMSLPLTAQLAVTVLQMQKLRDASLVHQLDLQL